jgi:hypothetical protein
MNVKQTITIGMKRAIGSTSPSGEFLVIFEDDGESAYFYALNASPNDPSILDLINIYTVEQVSDCKTPCSVEIIWSNDGSRVILTIDGYPHAAFDFPAKQGYGRTNYPNVPRPDGNSWHSDDHKWSDSVLQWFR